MTVGETSYAAAWKSSAYDSLVGAEAAVMSFTKKLNRQGEVTLP